MTLKRKEVGFGIAGNVLYLDLGVVTEVCNNLSSCRLFSFCMYVLLKKCLKFWF